MSECEGCDEEVDDSEEDETHDVFDCDGEGDGGCVRRTGVLVGRCEEDESEDGVRTDVDLTYDLVGLIEDEREDFYFFFDTEKEKCFTKRYNGCTFIGFLCHRDDAVQDDKEKPG